MAKLKSIQITEPKKKKIKWVRTEGAEQHSRRMWQCFEYHFFHLKIQFKAQVVALNSQTFATSQLFVVFSFVLVNNTMRVARFLNENTRLS